MVVFLVSCLGAADRLRALHPCRGQEYPSNCRFFRSKPAPMLKSDKCPPIFLYDLQAWRISLLVNEVLLGMQGLTRTLLCSCWASWGELLYML